VNFVQGDAVCFAFANECLDVVFMVAVLGEIPDKARCLQEIHRVLQEQGLLSITEQPGDPDFIPMSDLLKLTENAGFRLARSFGRSRNYTINLRKVVE
jgi:ubiquinone/menaquinone biosynthesis C-methylase UbiE